MDSQVYLFLAKKGPQKGKDITKALKINRPQLYRSLKSLQGKGIVSSTLQRPARFSAVPFEEALDMFIKAKMEEAQRLQQNKSEMLSHWRSIEIAETVDSSAKFMLIEGRSTVYSKILQMITETKNRLSTITTVQGLLRADQFGLFDVGFDHPLKTKIQFRFLTELSQHNSDAMKTLLVRKPYANLKVEGRSINSGLKLFPRLVIRDEEEIILFITSSADTPASEQEDVGLWTNSKALVHAFSVVFEELWRNSTDVHKKLLEIETGIPAPETHIVRDAETARKKCLEILNSAKEEIMILTSPNGVIRNWEGRRPLVESREKGVRIRIMAPITSENIEAAKQLSKYFEVRHVSSSYLRTIMVDGKHLFLFKTPPSAQEKLEMMPYLENTFYSNDSEYVEIMKNMLNEIWNRACALSEVTLESVIRSPAPAVHPSDSVSAVAKVMTNHDVGAVVIVEDKTPIGIITEKDIVQRVINARRDPAKTLVKDVMSSPLITIDHKQTSKQALEVMHKHKIRRLVVIKGEKLAGLITERRALRSCSLLTQWN